MPDTPKKRCSRGDQCVDPMGCCQPANLDHFPPDKRASDGFNYSCRSCERERGRIYREQNPDRIREIAKKHRDNNPDMVSARNKRYRERHRERIDLRQKTIRRRYYLKHRDTVLRRASEKAKRDRPKITERERKRRQQNPIPGRLKGHKRRARLRSLPSTFTQQHWERALDYFKGCCAVCGRPAGLWHTLSPDHWIPIVDPNCPGNVPENIVPLCNALADGTDGCNNAKTDLDATEWLTRKFGKRRAAKIKARIEAYFEWVRNQP